MPEKPEKVIVPKTVKYVALFDCTYKNRWTRRGTVIELPEDVQFNHKCFVKYDPKVHIDPNSAEMFDKAGDEIRARRIDAVMDGVYRQNN